MNTATPQQAAPRPIKGSWEDLHAQAQQHARNYNDEAIPLYQRVFNGLMALPPAARAAGDDRLYNLMMTAGVELQGYFNLRDRYDESLAVIEKMLAIAAVEDKPQLIELKSDVLLQAERGDEAILVLRELIASEDADAADWGRMVAGYIRMKQPEKALVVVDEMEPWIEAQVEVGRIEGQEIEETKYYQERLRAAALLELGRTDEVVNLFDNLYASGGAAAMSPHLIYTRLIQEGRYDQALRYINRDQARPVRAAFWRGVTYRYKGELARANRIWEDALVEEIVHSDPESIVEHILTHYYLGDRNGTGLETVLRAQREQPRLSWMIFLLTALGWIVRKDNKAAHSNLRLAISQVKAMGDGKTLAHQYWRILRDLAPEGKTAQFARYFDTLGPEGSQESSQTSSEVSSEVSGESSGVTPTPDASAGDSENAPEAGQAE